MVEFDDSYWFEFLDVKGESGKQYPDPTPTGDALTPWEGQVEITPEDVAEAIRDWDKKAPRGWRGLLFTERPKASKYSPDQPRVAAGNPQGGQWTAATVNDVIDFGDADLGERTIREKVKHWVKSTFGSWRSSLTRDERYGISMYTGGSYQWINSDLAKKGEVRPEYKEIVSLLDSALAKAQLPQAVKVYHGGKVAESGAYTSTSLSRREAAKFGDVSEILLPKGFHCGYVSNWENFDSGELEVLLPRGTKYVKVGRNRYEARA